MRKELKYIIWVHVAIALFLLYQTFDLLTLIMDDTFQDALLEGDLNGKHSGPQQIPKIIHQTYKTNDIPEIWREGQQRCIDLHPDYEYILWTDEMSRNFIAEEYPWFLKTFDNYKYPIERADSIRYFILNHFGGIYIDLDDGCSRKLDPLLSFPAFVRRTSPTGVSNDVMGSVPRHPFFQRVMESLEKYDKNWLIPYLTIMYSTGPLFVSVVWKQYKRWGVPDSGQVRVLQPADYKGNINSFFSISEGSSWHLDDAKFIKSLARHLTLAVMGGFAIAGLILFTEYLIYCFFISNLFKRLKRRSVNFVLGRGWNCTEAETISSKYKRLDLIKKRSRKDSNLPVVMFESEKPAASAQQGLYDV